MPAPAPDPLERPRASVSHSMLEGWRRTIAAPWVMAGLASVAILLLWPLPSVPAPGDLDGTMIREIFGYDGAIVFGSPLSGGGWVDRRVAVYLLFWFFASAGTLDRLARGRQVGTSAFFSACGVYGVRFLRLGVITGVTCWALFRWALPPESARGQYAIFLIALLGINLIADIARVRLVVEDRHSVIGALASSVRFIRRRPLRTLGLYMANAAAMAILALAWSRADSSGLPSPWPALHAMALLLTVLVARVAMMTSETVFFQGELAHAHYTAAPLPTWPDSAAVEAIRNLRLSGQKADGDAARQKAEGRRQKAEGKRQKAKVRTRPTQTVQRSVP